MLEDYPCSLCGWTDGEHGPGCIYNTDLPGLCHTQGGGTVKWDKINKRWVFVTSPPDLPKYRVGDFMPEEWGIA